MVLVGYIAAPPTSGSFRCAVAEIQVTARAAAAMSVSDVFFIVLTSIQESY
jgi:hypothetical protein